MNNGPFIDDLPTVFKMVIFHGHSHVKSPNGSKWVKSSKSHLISLHEVDYIRSIITCNSSKKTQHDPAKKRQESSTAIWMTNTSYSIREWSGIYHGHARIKCKCETNINKWLNGFRKLQQEKKTSAYISMDQPSLDKRKRWVLRHDHHSTAHALCGTNRGIMLTYADPKPSQGSQYLTVVLWIKWNYGSKLQLHFPHQHAKFFRPFSYSS